MKVLKRDKTIEIFSMEKIENAVKKAFASCNKEMPANALDSVKSLYEQCGDEQVKKVEEIQDDVEDCLMSSYPDVAKHYIIYRYEHKVIRETNDKLYTAFRKKLLAQNIENQNANVDEESFGGRMGEATSVVTRDFALKHCVCRKSMNNHLNNEVYIHDLDSYSVGDSNCDTLPIDDLLANGFWTRQTDIRPAKSINSAFQLVAVLFQLQSLQQFGGVSASHIDWSMVPYMRKSFFKNYVMNYIKESEDITSMDIINMSYEDLDDWISDHKQEYLAKLNLEEKDFTLDNIGNLDKRLSQLALFDTKNDLHQAVEGMYHNLNSLQSRSGNQLPFTSINYGTCTLPEGRMVIKALLEGCICGVGKFHKTSIFPCGIFQYMKGVNSKEGEPNYDLYKLALKSTSQRLYPNYANVDWSGNAGYDINDPKTYFSTMGALAGEEYLRVKIGGDMYKVTIKDLFDYVKTGKMVNFDKWLVLDTHSDNTANDEVEAECTYSITYTPEDVTYIGMTSNLQRVVEDCVNKIKENGVLNDVICYDDKNLANYKLEVLSYCETDGDKHRYIEKATGITSITRQHTMHELNKTVQERPNFVQDRTIPQDLIDIKDKDIKVLDRGYKWVKINHIFKNDKLNTPFMMCIYFEDSKDEYCIKCTEDHPLWDGQSFTRADKLSVGDNIYDMDSTKFRITNISWCEESLDSYDIGTVTGSFIGSDIVMHNCRTANGFDINGFGQLKDGRGNICPVTIIMPTLAMEASRDKDKFMKLLDKKIHEAKDMLIERFDWICSQSPNSASFMWRNNTMAGYVKEEGIRSALKHGTLAIGQIALAETLQLLIGEDQTTENGMKLAKEIEGLFSKRCKEFKEEYKLNFGVYYTPAENLCYTSLKKFKEKYGVIENVSDKEFFTNSIHVPVWKNMSVFEKIDIESQLTGYSNAGCITYVELPSTTKHNIESLETIVNYAMDKDIPYFAVNVPNDTCEDCGYTDEINGECPMCGSNNILQLRRVTGYLSTTYKHFNLGKQDEVEHRVKHSIQNDKKE